MLKLSVSRVECIVLFIYFSFLFIERMYNGKANVALKLSVSKRVSHFFLLFIEKISRLFSFH